MNGPDGFGQEIWFPYYFCFVFVFKLYSNGEDLSTGLHCLGGASSAAKLLGSLRLLKYLLVLRVDNILNVATTLRELIVDSGLKYS